MWYRRMTEIIFQSTLPVWGATPAGARGGGDMGEFQSTLPVWGATCVALDGGLQWEISIHAPRVGSDYKKCRLSKWANFNPRSPCGERPWKTPRTWRQTLFQSTLPVWGATLWTYASAMEFPFQSTLPVWGATVYKGRFRLSRHISIHAPRVGSDSLSRS